jgi:hypothetical protein
MNGKSYLKPQDILVLLKLLANPGFEWRQVDLAISLGLSQAETGLGLRRLWNSRLVDQNKKLPNKINATEFLIYGLKYIYPVERGAITKGISTIEPPTGKKNISKDIGKSFVWACDQGNTQGQSIQPIYPSVAVAALKDSFLYELLVLTDGLRLVDYDPPNSALEKLKKLINRENKL